MSSAFYGWQGPWPDDLPPVSCGEVTLPETFDFRTLTPVPGGLFCERIFGPENGWRCRCGGSRGAATGVLCEQCGVEVSLARLRTEPVAHVQLAAPVTNFWSRLAAGGSPVVMDRVPVLSPALRPLIQVDARRFRWSDLNDLYRRLLNRNHRVRKLRQLTAPPEILAREEELLQLSVDALLDNRRCDKPVLGQNDRPLHGLADLFARLYGVDRWP
jgi:DNA-directed RNA polymerase beta' subunit